MRKALAIVLCVCALLQVQADAWGVAGHRVVSRAAIRALPADVPPFLARQIDWIGRGSVLADTWRAPSEPFAKAAEDPNHVWYMEQFAFLRQVPRSRDEFMLAVYDEHLRLRASDPAKAALTNIHYTGTLPYAATEGYERLKVAFRTWRELNAKKQDTTFIEQDAAFYLGWMSHYIADGAIHWQFENTFVDLIDLRESDVQGRIPTAPKKLPDPFAAVLAHLDRAHTRVDQLYQLERNRAYDDKNSQQGRELVYVCIADAATLLRDLIYTAWMTSADPVPSFDPDDQTNNPKNPRYNPATGSAPPLAP